MKGFENRSRCQSFNEPIRQFRVEMGLERQLSETKPNVYAEGSIMRLNLDFI